MEMLAGVKSQMSGWLSGGIPGLSGRGAAETTEGSGEIPPASTEAVDNQTPREIVQGSSPDHVKDDDASRWVSGYVDCVLQAAGHVPIIVLVSAYHTFYAINTVVQ